MGNFKRAFARTMEYEGGYSNDPTDRGGETYRGISRKNFPRWEGWITIDNLKFVKLSFDNNEQLQNDVETFYQREFWNRIRGDELGDPLAREMFDCAVNHGVSRAVKFLQRSIGIEADGGFGPKTLEAVKKADEDVMVVDIKQRRREFYQQIVSNDPSQARFLKGWMRRADESVA